MIDREDFPRRTPQEYMAEFNLIFHCGDSAEALAARTREHERIERLFQKYIVAKQNLNVKVMSLEELTERFEEISLVEGETAFEWDVKEEIKKGVECAYALETVSTELKRRGKDARRLLSRFYDHPNERVQLNAALHSYVVMPDAARQVMERLRSSVEADVFFENSMTLHEIDSGKWTPD